MEQTFLWLVSLLVQLTNQVSALQQENERMRSVMTGAGVQDTKPGSEG